MDSTNTFAISLVSDSVLYQAGVNKLADLVGVTLGPKGRNVVLESKYGSPRIVNDGVTVAREVCNSYPFDNDVNMHSKNRILSFQTLSLSLSPQVELEDPVENIGAKLVRQAAAKTNDLAGDGTTTSVVLAQGFIAEGVKVCVTFFFQLSLVKLKER